MEKYFARSALKALEELDYNYHPEPNGEPWYRAHDVWAILDSMPNANVISAVPGHWVRVKWVEDDTEPDGGWWIVRCSACTLPHDKESRFCPNCGNPKREEERDDG